MRKKYEILIKIPAYGKNKEEARREVVSHIKSKMPNLEFYPIYDADDYNGKEDK